MSEEIKRRSDCTGHSAPAPGISPHGGDIYAHRDAILDFSVNTNPLGPPTRVLEAAKRGVDLSVHYPDMRCRKLKKALAAKLTAEFSAGVSFDDDAGDAGRKAADGKTAVRETVDRKAAVREAADRKAAVCETADEGNKNREGGEVLPDAADTEEGNRCRESRKIREDMLIIGNGAADLLYTYVFAAKPKCALLAVPCFSEYEKALHAADCTVRYLYLKEEENFRVTEAILDGLTADVDLCILCSPSNPAGQVIEKELLGRIVNRCIENQIRLVLDESFRFFSFPAKSSAETSLLCSPAVSRKDEKDGKDRKDRKDRKGRKGRKDKEGTVKVHLPGNLFLLRSFTKIYAIPGLRLGYGICADSELIGKMEASRQDWSVSVPAQEAGLAAIKEPEAGTADSSAGAAEVVDAGGDDVSYIRRTRELIRTERERLERAFSAFGLSYIPSEANFILFKSDADLYHALLNIGILIRDCANYRGLGKGWYRVSVRTEEENTVLIRAMKEILSFTENRK